MSFRDSRSRGAISETTDFFRIMWDRFKIFLEQIFWMTLNTDVQLLRQLISLHNNMEKGEDTLRTSHLDDLTSRSAISETADFLRTMWDRFKIFLGQIFWMTLNTEVQLLRQ